jgi:hypothetical protein
VPKIDLISRDESFEIGDAECSFTLRRLDPDVVRESRHRHTRRLEPDGPGQRGREEVDECEVDKDILDHVILGWRGVLGVDGAEAPCTRETKWHLPGTIKGQILIAAQAVNREGVLEADLKNLRPSSGRPGPADGSTSGG